MSLENKTKRALIGLNEKSKLKQSIKAKVVLKWIFISLAILCLLALLSFVVFINVAYSSFYNRAIKEFDTPGLSEGFIPQSISHVDKNDSWIFSGYMDNGSASPIYKRSNDGVISRIFLYMPDGKTIFTGHGGGICANNKWVYITYESSYLVIGLDDVLNASNDEFVTVKGEVEVEYTPAFISIIDDKLFLGNFYHKGKYDSPQKMHLQTPSGETNYAVMYSFPKDDSEEFGFSRIPSIVYSIPDKVQGVCLTNDKFIFSTSWGISPSILPLYDANSLFISGTYDYSLVSIASAGKGNADDGILNTNDVNYANELTSEQLASQKDIAEVPLVYFDSTSLVKSIEAPPMSEGITLANGRIYIENESASNRYIFGKLYSGSMIYSINVQ